MSRIGFITQGKDYKQGIRHVSAIVSNVVASTPVTLYILSTGRTARIRKVMAWNGNAANSRLQIGTGLAAAFAQQIPDLFLITGQDFQLEEEKLNAFEFTGNITMQATAAGAGAAAVNVQVEVEEYLGVSG